MDFFPLIQEVIRDCQALAENLRQEKTNDLLQLENMLWSAWLYSRVQISQVSQSANMTGVSSHHEGIRFSHDLDCSADALMDVDSLMDVDDDSQVCVKYLKILLAHVFLPSPLQHGGINEAGPSKYSEPDRPQGVG